jgi:Major Facilitator Superfamily
MADNISDEPSEHTPLLPKINVQTNGAQGELSAHPTDPSASLLPQGADPYVEEHRVADASNGDIENQAEDQREPTQYAGIPEVRKVMIYIFPAIAIGVFLAAADGSIIVTSYGKIGSELDALNMTSWIANAYFLTLTAFQPLYGKLSDIFGRKACLLFAYLVFGIGSLFCGIAQNINQLIAARAFAGIGGGGMTTIVSILLSDIVPLRDRGTWQGYINIVYATGAATGAPLGGKKVLHRTHIHLCF